MVRLKANLVSGESTQPAFQFHYGTIKSHQTGRSSPTLEDFNSTMVRLKVLSCLLLLLGLCYFNSTMVRLKENETTFS